MSQVLAVILTQERAEAHERDACTFETMIALRIRTFLTHHVPASMHGFAHVAWSNWDITSHSS